MVVPAQGVVGVVEKVVVEATLAGKIEAMEVVEGALKQKQHTMFSM